MQLRSRRILASSFILIFIIAAPVVIYYEQGYRFNLKTWKSFRTGILNISGNPKTVDIFLGEENYENTKLPTLLRSLNPGLYPLRISTTGYQNFQTDVSIIPGQVTIIQNLQLFREQPFSLLQTAIKPQALLAPNGGAVAWVDGKHIVIALANQKIQTTEILQLKQIIWDPTGSRIIALDEKGLPLAIIDRTAQVSLISKTPISTPLSAVSESLLLLKKDNQYAIWQGNSWNTFSISNSQNPQIIRKTIFTLRNLNNNLFLFRTSANGKDEAQIALPKMQSPKLRQSNEHIWVSDTQTKKTYLIVDENLKQPLRQLDFETTNIQPVPQTQDLLLTNQNEAWILDAQKNVNNASRWVSPIIKAVGLGQHSLLLVRTNELFASDLVYNQVQQKTLLGVTSASMTNTPGVVDFLMKDGDLLQWMQGKFF